jgi:hypothetical protein
MQKNSESIAIKISQKKMQKCAFNSEKFGKMQKHGGKCGKIKEIRI